MTRISPMMHDDHQRCDALFATAEEAVSDQRWDDAGVAFSAFREATLHHFAMEEEVLFPSFEEASGNGGGPTEMMRYEHRQMRGLMEEMAQGASGMDGALYLGAAETLLMLMQQHNLKEEQILYPMTEQLLGETQGEVIERMKRL
ncbi:hemerythrin domain-containing protein [Endothiovibrio diazotrophicus]